MWDWSFQNAALVTGALAAVAGFLTAGVVLLNAWRDGRRLRIQVSPVRWGYRFPADEARTLCSVTFTVSLWAVNPARTPNRISAIRAWRDDQEVPYRMPSVELPPGDSVVIQPYQELRVEVVIVAFDGVPDVTAAVNNVALLRIEVAPLRGRRRSFVFEPAAFPRT
jgi:hypothetical protein